VLEPLSRLRRYRIATPSLALGRPEDFYFDDRRWTVRYVVATAGRWRTRRRVLVPAAAVRGLDPPRRRLRADLRRGWVAAASTPETDPPVSRQLEVELEECAGLVADWSQPLVLERATRAGRGDRHLRSAAEVAGYHLHTTDGQLGHVADFLVETDSWVIRYLIVTTRDWRPGKRVLLPPGWVTAVSWGDAAVDVDLDGATVAGAPAYVNRRPIDTEQELHLFAYYGRPARARAQAGATGKGAIS
jgi:hypothetical protein